MPYVIGPPCIGTKDNSCIEVCPVDCIHETTEMLVIDPGECIDCGACVAECPVEAIAVDDELPAGWEPFVEINAAWPVGGREAVEVALARHQKGEVR
jgi:ferredoxin